MTATRETYLIRIAGPWQGDVPATLLVLVSRGRAAVAGDAYRADRDGLAELLPRGPLADLLRSGDPIVADSRSADSYEFRRT